MNQSNVLSGWSELPAELLDIISTKLINYVDYVRLRAVCPSWKSHLPKKPSHLLKLTQLPWLLLPHYENNIVSETHCSFFNIADEKTYRLELPEAIAKGKQCWGSPHGWLVTLDEEGPCFGLLNPLTRDEKRLPTLFFFPSTLQNDQVSSIVLPWDSIGYLRYSSVVKAALFAKPSVSTGYIVIVLMEDGPCNLAFFRSGDMAWTPILEAEQNIYKDVVCFEGQFYVVDSKGSVYLCHLGASPNVVKVADPPENPFADGPEKMYLVESVNELLLVYRHHIYLNGRSYDSTYYFTVHKPDLSKSSSWSNVEDMGDQVLFLGTNCSFSLSARNYPFRRNSIYYTDDYRFPIGSLGDSQSRSECIRGYDLGLFNLDDGGVDMLPSCPVSNLINVKYMRPAPVWITLSP
ncbi:hypothetical protein AQUCO_08200045v1 [Aquilegia coerulea]|uniref:KIB1-4 beta-propeller domain-containing protein n=1 Tax=Aquilegia coerulea TaxID=218851 RepID=A0A2G5C7I4_AQUCA|nr:hypothetical protein AQUCO_08200045v1 [Aquilegia coerulea]